MKIELNESSSLPKYQQMAEELCRMIKSGELKPGEKLPPERELGKENELARGTVQAAYQEMIRRGFAYAVRGSGTYIVNSGNELKEEALKKEFEAIFERADQMNLPYKEVADIFRRLLVRRMAGDVKLMTAWVDCCPEALQLAKNEFKNVENNRIQQFLLDAVIKEQELLNENFDLIVTTSHHYETFIQVFPDLVNKVELVTINVSSETLIELAKIPPETKVAVWTISKIFMENLLWHVRDLNNIKIVKMFISDKARDEIENYLQTVDLLIISKEYWELGEPAMLNLIEKYKQEGGRVLYFEYVFDPGSILHLQTRIYEKIVEKEKNML